MELDLIIVVDDDETTRFLLRIMIEQVNPLFQVKDFETVKEALQMIENHFDAPLSTTKPIKLFMDLQMPQYDGLYFLKEIDKFTALQKKQISAYVLSSSVVESEKQEVETFDFVKGFIEKPIEPTELQKIL